MEAATNVAAENGLNLLAYSVKGRNGKNT